MIECNSTLLHKGRAYPCDMPTNDEGRHPNWAHSNTGIEAMWTNEGWDLEQDWRRYVEEFKEKLRLKVDILRVEEQIMIHSDRDVYYKRGWQQGIERFRRAVHLLISEVRND